MFIDRWLGKENVVNINSWILVSFKRERNFVIFNNMEIENIMFSEVR